MVRLGALSAVIFLAASGCAAGAPAPAPPAAVFIPFTGVTAAPPALARSIAAPLDRPGRYRVAFSAHREHGCSLSYAISDAHGEVVLDLAEDGRAALTMTSTTASLFGSRWGGGSPDRSEARAASSWKGQARQRAGKIEVVLAEIFASCGGGGCADAKKVTLSCAFERVDLRAAVDPGADPAADSPAAAATVPVVILRCSGGPAPFGDGDPAFVEHLALSRAEPLVLSSHHGGWQAQEATLSLASPP